MVLIEDKERRDRAIKLYNSNPEFRRLAKLHLAKLIEEQPGRKDFNYARAALIAALEEWGK